MRSSQLHKAKPQDDSVKVFMVNVFYRIRQPGRKNKLGMITLTLEY
jgi:hypothetical protein